jgi:signal transduction histidine kinase
MALRTPSRVVVFLKEPAIHFFLIASIPVITGMILSPMFAPSAQRELVDFVLICMGGLLIFQAAYVVSARRFRTKQHEDLLRTVAHQLRTPVSSLRWIMSEASRRDASVEERADLRRMGEASIDKINEIMDAFLLHTHSQGLHNPTAHLDICELIEKGVEEAEPLAKQFGVDVHLEGPCEELWVNVSPAQFEVVLANLITNAIRYNHRGGMVAVSARRVHGGSSIEISVRDTGVGIAAHEQAKIFGRFYRTAAAQRLDAEGSGLGLAVAKQIVEEHGGSIGFDSTPGKGTTFHVTLPAAE